MCSACGFPAAPGHWTEAGPSTPHDRMRAKFRRAQVLQKVLPAYGLKVFEGGQIEAWVERVDRSAPALA